MNYGDAIRFPFRGAKPWKNIALMSLCNLIPILGPIVLIGYGAYVERVLARDLAAAAPEFDFNRFMKYLERGVAPFVINLVIGLALVPVIWGVIFVGILVVAASRGEAWGVVLGATVIIGGAVTLVLAVGLLISPLNLRAMLLGSLGQALDFRWSVDFVRRVLGAALISLIVFPLIAIPLAIVGLLACYIGIFFVGSIITLIQWHIQVQLYHLYLDRGGVPLAIVDDPIPPAFPVESGIRRN